MKTNRVRHGDDVWRSSFLTPFMDSKCHVRNNIYVLLWQTVSVIQVLFWCLFPSLLRNSGNKHQNIPLVSDETVRHSSTYIILYVFLMKSWHGMFSVLLALCSLVTGGFPSQRASNVKLCFLDHWPEQSSNWWNEMSQDSCVVTIMNNVMI